MPTKEHRKSASYYILVFVVVVFASNIFFVLGHLQQAMLLDHISC